MLKRKSSFLVLSTVSIAALMATPAFGQAATGSDATTQAAQDAQAQTNNGAAVDNAEGQAEKDNTVVVTGSRIRHDNFATPQNVDIITRDDEILAGSRSTTDILQSATVTSGTSQISGSFLGYLSDGGQAANVVGLRGLGASRTLILLNGRRLAPAGVGPQLVSADLNVLPTSIVQRIEVLREGASSIYGSDAIAGVINIITDTKINGITFDAFTDTPEEGAGNSYRVSVTAGKTFDRGHITLAAEYRQDNGLQLGDRSIYTCPRELAFIDGKEVGQGSPDDPNKIRCFPFERAGLGTANGYGLAYSGYLNYQAGPGQPIQPLVFGFLGREGLTDGSTNNPPLNVDDFNLRPLQRPISLQDTMFSPITTYTAYGNGSYELGVGDLELYGEGLFNRRDSHQQGSTQLNFQSITNFGEAQLYGGNLLDLQTGNAVPCADVFGSACSPFFPKAWANSGINYFSPFVVPNHEFQQSQRVNYFRGNAGIRGGIGIGDWRVDANAMISRTRSRDTIQGALTDRVNNVLVAVKAPAGTPAQYITTALSNEVGAGNSYTCAANVTAGAYNGGTCVPIDFYNPDIFVNGNLPQSFYDYVYQNSTGRTLYNQETYSIGFDGSLFHLPGGMAKAAFGFEHRHDKIDDEPSVDRLNGTLYGYGIAQATKGSDIVNEAYGEIDLPILSKVPFFDTLDIEGSARYTNYRSYGSDWTYAFRGEWAPISNIRFRGNYGTNFRAPNLYEQNVANQVGFYPGSLDPCDQFGTRLSATDQVYKNCLAQLTPILDNPATVGVNEALDYKTTGSFQVTTSGGKGVLSAEKATTWGFGTVLTAPKRLVDLTLAVDYWNVDVRGEVGNLGNLILNFCYQAADFPNNPYCGFIDGRITDKTDPHVGEITNLRNPYLNIAQQKASGIDFDMRFATDLFGGKFSTQLQATRNIHQQTQYFPGGALNDYNGQLGYPGAGAGPKWVGSLDTRYSFGHVTLRWGVQYVGPAEDKLDPYYLLANGDPCPPTADPVKDCKVVQYDTRAERYWEHGFSVQYLWKNVGQFTVGVKNAFNAKPPMLSAHPNDSAPRIGNYFANGPYDYLGRSFFVNVTRSF